MRAGAAGYRASLQSTAPTQIPIAVFFMGASVTVYTHIVMDRPGGPSYLHFTWNRTMPELARSGAITWSTTQPSAGPLSSQS